MADSIGFDPVAWSVDGGKHPGDLFRLVAYAATSGEEGIVTPGDCKVHALSNPGPQVNMDPGALLIRNRSSNVKNQTYVANARLMSAMDVASTVGQGARQDLVVVRIEDPQYSPWPLPAEIDRPNYQYTKPFIYQNVPPGTDSALDLNLGYSALALARIEMPAGQTNVLNEYIKDLRRVANPRTKTEVVGLNNDTVGHVFDPATAGSSAFETWPGASPKNLYIPEWATRMTYFLVLGQAIPKYDTLATTGYWRLNIGNGAILGDSIQWEVDSTNAINPQTIANADTVDIPSNIRGTTQSFKTEIRRIAGDSGLSFKNVSSLAMTFVFEEAPV